MARPSFHPLTGIFISSFAASAGRDLLILRPVLARADEVIE
jgi:hypothetical protein